jgi:type IV secretion system protein TrbJ
MTNFINTCCRLRTPKKLAIAAAITTTALLLMPTPAAALFGLGDIVFDPTSYATLAKIWSSNASTLTKVTEEVAQLGQIYANGVQTYKQALAMAQRVNQFTRLNWLTVGITAVNDATANQFGEAANWAALVNGNPALASSVWKSATLPMNANSSSFLSGETLGSSANLANLASIEASDGSSTKCLAEIAEYRSAAQTNTLAIAQLQSADDDDSDSTNSEIEQLNLVNAAQAAGLHEQQSQGALHACLVEQQVLANTWQRNAAAEAMNSYGTANVSRQADATEYGNVQETYYGYVPQ